MVQTRSKTKAEALAKAVEIEEQEAREESSNNGEVDYSSVTLFRNPITTVVTLIKVLFNLVISTPGFILRHYLIFTLLPGAAAAFHYLDGPHTEYKPLLEEQFMFGAWWIGLGVASSVGLGTGLHTFMLYLGPHIAKVTMAAYECNQAPVSLPSQWSHESFAVCEKFEGTPTITLTEIFWCVILEASLWGLGTAIGELPPYFISKAAALSGKKDQELKDMEGEMDDSFFGKCKATIYTQLKKRAFIVVLLCASIPNPLFDLAGLTCGHFLIPFMTFFGATFIGKAIVKVSIQCFFVIVMFSAHHAEHLLTLIEENIPSLHGTLSDSLEKQKAKLFNPDHDTNETPSILAQVWEYFIYLMVGFFVLSFVNSIVQNHLEHEQTQRRKKQTQTPKKNKED